MQSVNLNLRPAPPFTLGAALLLWGWQTNFLVYAIPMALVLELSHWAGWRWPVTDKEFNNTADLSGVIFFILVIYIFTTVGAKGIFVILSIMPFVLYLLLLVQRYSETGAVKASVLFVSLRRLDTKTSPELNTKIDLSLPYLMFCIVSASSGNQRTAWFFILTIILIAVVAFSWRPKRYSAVIWTGLLFVSVSLAYASQLGMRELHRSIEMSMMSLFDKYMWRYRDPERATTAIGSIGRIKFSDRILIRVESDKDLEQPLFLKEASYSNYGYGVWSNSNSGFSLIDPDAEGRSWTFSKEQTGNTVSVSTYMPKEIGVIPAPIGTNRIHNVTALEINRNNYGAVKMEIREGWIKYWTDYGEYIDNDIAANEDDLYVPETYKEDFERLARELDLYGKQTNEIVRIVEDHFTKNFQYSLTRQTRYPRGKYLHNFLFNERQGHCEFFATSTVLVLRVVGIPARYTVGYVVDEYSNLERKYIARARDAHSWASYYDNGLWQTLDTTPSVWAPYEDAHASAFEPLFDLVAWIKYQFAQFQSKDELEDEETSNEYLLWLLIPMGLFLIWRLFIKERIARKKDIFTKKRTIFKYGQDSALYKLIPKLEQAGYFRREGETLHEWFVRLNKELNITDLMKALQLHYRYRFDPQNSTEEVSNQITQLVNDILTAGAIRPNHQTEQTST